MLGYLATAPDAKVRYQKFKIISNVHSDASYLPEARARSHVAGYYYMGLTSIDGQPIPLNEAVYVFGGILKFVVASATL